MGEIASAHVTIYPKFSSGFGSGVKGEISKVGDDAGKGFGTRFARAMGTGKTSGGGALGGAMLGLKAGLVGLVAGFTIGPIIDGFKSTTGAASDLNETVSKSKTIFGSQYSAMDQWASGAATSLGLSKAAALEASSGFANMFTQLGFTGKASADMSRQVLQMATDMGSFNNLPTADVANMISAAFRGEYDSLQRLIPTINAAAVEQKALEMTGKKSAKALTQQEKAAATLALVQQGANVAMGDFAKTSDGAANKAKINAARMEELSAKFGGLLGPIQSVAQDGFGALLAAGEGFTAWLERNPEVIEGFAAGLSLAGDALKGLAMLAAPVFVILIRGFGQVLQGVSGFLEALSTIPGFEWADEAAVKVRKMADGALIAADGVAAWGDEVWGLSGRLKEVPAVTEAEVLAPGAKPSKADVDALIKSVGTVPTLTESEIRTVANLYGVEVAKAAIAQVKDKTVTITTRFAYSGNPVYVSGSGARLEADGGVLSFYGSGGFSERHVAQIAPAGAMRVWAEPETGGEAYIPLALSKRSRSLDIWAETGRRLGVAGYANGAVSGGATDTADLARAIADAIAKRLNHLGIRVYDVIDKVGDVMLGEILVGVGEV